MQLIDIFSDFGNSWKLLKVVRDEKGIKKREEINNFTDYFYSTENKLLQFLDTPLIKEQILSYEKCDIPAFNCNEKIYKIFLKNVLWGKKRIVKTLFNELDGTFELDVAPSIRYAIDNIKSFDKTNYNILFFDIETTTDIGFPNWKNAIEKITCITFYDNYTKQYTSFILNPDKDIKKNRTIDNKKIIFFNDEKVMIQEFMNLVSKNDYDILTAWNISFDLTYIFGRCDKLKLNKHKLSPYGEVIISTKLNKQNREETFVDIKGRFVIDLLLRYKGIIFKEIPTYRLDYVSELELGPQKKKMKVLDFSGEWREHLDRLIEYSIRDVEILVELNKKLHLINYLEELRMINYLPNIYYASIAKHLIDISIFREYKNKLLMPSKQNIPRQKLGGGFVKIPIPGIYNNIAVFDFAGMYPSLIQTFNLSKDTIVPLKEADFIINEDDIDENEMLRERYETGWTLNHKGIIPTILTKFLNVRKKIKEEMKGVNKNSIEYRDMNLRQYALKAPINANYGVNAYPGFRLYEPRVAATITYLGRKLNQYCSKRIEEEYNLKVLYNDTDSFFVEIKDKNIIKDIEESINKKYVIEFINEYSNNKIITSYIKVEYEKFFEKLLLIKKRRYLGILNTGEWLYKGVDLKRSNTPEIIKEILQYYIDNLFKGDNKNILKECYNKLIYENDFDKFKIPLKISKEYLTNLPQQRAANWANTNLKSNFKQGSKFYGLYVKNNQTDIVGFTDIIELNSFKIEIDIDKYIKILKMKLENLNTTNIELNFNFEQTTLASF